MSQLGQAMQEVIDSVKAKSKKARKPKSVSTESQPIEETPPVESGEDFPQSQMSLGEAFEAADQSTGSDDPPKEKRVKKAKTKKAAPKKAAPKKAAPKKAAPKKTKKSKATKNQIRAVKTRLPRNDWTAEVEKFRRSNAKNFVREMGSDGSAQVTRVRVSRIKASKGLTLFTKKKLFFMSKLDKDAAVAAARKAGKL